MVQQQQQPQDHEQEGKRQNLYRSFTIMLKGTQMEIRRNPLLSHWKSWPVVPLQSRVGSSSPTIRDPLLPSYQTLW